MCQFFETLRVENGAFANIAQHILRLKNTYAEYPSLRLPELDTITIPDEFADGVFRCRIDYSTHQDPQIAYYHYQPRVIRSLKIINVNELDYHLKYSDRSSLETLFSLREKADEILIVKNGLITDTSYTNVVFFDGNQYFTPLNPLLKGTQLATLMKERQVIECDISINDLSFFQHVCLVNAMMPMDNCPKVFIENIF